MQTLKHDLKYRRLGHLWPSGHNGYSTRLHIRDLQVRVLYQNIYFLKKLNHLMGIKLSIVYRGGESGRQA